MPDRILVVDDEKKIRTILSHILSDEGFEVSCCESGEDALSCVESVDPSLILMDQNMPGMNGIETMHAILTKRPESTIIILTAYGSIPLAVEAMKKGAFDYLTKPFDNEELIIVVNRAIDHTRLEIENRRLRKELREKYCFDNIIGTSQPVRRLFEQMHRVLNTDATVLVQGESGTGKELVTRALHYHGTRAGKALVSVNCGALPVNLIESEFFGHEKGSFTGAVARKIGSFEAANEGTLFLDEIGELPLDSQVKFLRVLEDMAVTRIGGTDKIPVDVRIIAATNKDLKEEVALGRFRLDLYYRLNVFTLELPPLRDRKEDIPLLIEHFIDKCNEKMGTSVNLISSAAVELLVSHDWPGNVRDLENAVQSAIILSDNNRIDVASLPLRIRGDADTETLDITAEIGLEGLIKRQVEKLEKNIILEALEKQRGNKSETASLLKISRKTLFNKLKQMGIDNPEK